MKSLKYNLLALAVLALAITPSFGNPIPIYSTGQSNTSYNQVDPNYTILPGAPCCGTDAYTVQPYSGAWVTPPAGT